MDKPSGFFDIDKRGDVLIVTPAGDMGELEFELINLGIKEVLHAIQESSVKSLVMDFRKTTYFGSTALGFFLRVWKTISMRNGRMAFCNTSEHEREILKVTKLDTLWEICSTQADALQFVSAPEV